MFDVYYSSRGARRLQTSRDAAELAGFVGFLHRRGHARSTVHQYLRAARTFLQWLRRRRKPLLSVDEAVVRRFACRRSGDGRPSPSVHAALNHLLGYLRRDVRASLPMRAPSAVDRVIVQYDAHLDHDRGLAEATRLYRRRYAREFMQFVFGSTRIDWRRLRPRHVHDYIGQYGTTGRVAAAQVATVSLRSFLQWLRFCGRIRAELVMAVPHFRRWRFASLPAVLSMDQLATLLASIDCSRPAGPRDYAMTLCMVDLGLRVSEVADLQIDDFDAAASTIRLSAGKPRRERVLPTPRSVRQALSDYIRKYRPKTNSRSLFVRHRLPVGQPVTRELVRGVIRRLYQKVAGCESWTGTHALRHTAATRLQNAGADLKQVADILGHRSLDTTAIYTKVDRTRLAQVARPWPGADEVTP